MALLDITAGRGRQSIQEFTPDGRRDAAYRLHERGLPITLCRIDSKAPLDRGWPSRTWTHEEIDAAFTKHGDLNVGIVLGPRSGLIDIEIDDDLGEGALLDLFDGDVPVTPEWRSARGPHRLFQWHDNLAIVGKSLVRLGPLEIRLGANGRGAQSLLPPSITNGWGRRWSVSLDGCRPAVVPRSVIDKLASVFGRRSAQPSDRASRAFATQQHMIHSNIQCCVPSAKRHSGQDHGISGRDLRLPRDVQAGIQRAIESTLPGAIGFRNRLIFQFARQLQGMPALSVADPAELEPYVREWHRQASPTIGTQDFDVTWQDFLVGWWRVAYPAGEGPLDQAYRDARRQIPAIAETYRNQGVRNLVSLCRQLQLLAGDQPFWLACRPAAALLEVAPITACRWLHKLQYDRVIELVTLGARGRASEYRYRGD